MRICKKERDLCCFLLYLVHTLRLPTPLAVLGALRKQSFHVSRMANHHNGQSHLSKTQLQNAKQNTCSVTQPAEYRHKTTLQADLGIGTKVHQGSKILSWKLLK